MNHAEHKRSTFSGKIGFVLSAAGASVGLGNIWGSIIAAALLTLLPELLRGLSNYRMLIYAIVLIFVMLATNNPQAKAFFQRLLPHRRTSAEKED